jgi:hypothetical protein
VQRPARREGMHTKAGIAGLLRGGGPNSPVVIAVAERGRERQEVRGSGSGGGGGGGAGRLAAYSRKHGSVVSASSSLPGL